MNNPRRLRRRPRSASDRIAKRVSFRRRNHGGVSDSVAELTGAFARARALWIDRSIDDSIDDKFKQSNPTDRASFPTSPASD
jgi:ADP-ribosylglycohydrolase